MLVLYKAGNNGTLQIIVGTSLYDVTPNRPRNANNILSIKNGYFNWDRVLQSRYANNTLNTNKNLQAHNNKTQFIKAKTIEADVQ